MKGIFLDFATLGDGVSDEPLRMQLDQLTVLDSISAGEIAEACADVDAVFTNKCRFDAALLGSLKRLKYIGLTATGTDPIDLQAARANGVAVTNITGYCTDSVAQHVFATMLALTHNTLPYHQSVMQGRWQLGTSFSMLDYPIRELRGLTLGIFGYGELGHAVARIAYAFGMKVIVAQRDETDTRNGRLSKEQVLRRADVISLHCPLNDNTHHLIDAEALAMMKPDALLINSARGGLVDTDALAAALKVGAIGGAAIDVLPQEPPVDGNALIDSEINNLILSPHTAWGAREARQRAMTQTAENFAAFKAGEKLRRVELTQAASA